MSVYRFAGFQHSITEHCRRSTYYFNWLMSSRRKDRKLREERRKAYLADELLSRHIVSPEDGQLIGAIDPHLHRHLTDPPWLALERWRVTIVQRRENQAMMEKTCTDVYSTVHGWQCDFKIPFMKHLHRVYPQDWLAHTSLEVFSWILTSNIWSLLNELHTPIKQQELISAVADRVDLLSVCDNVNTREILCKMLRPRPWPQWSPESDVWLTSEKSLKLAHLLYFHDKDSNISDYLNSHMFKCLGAIYKSGKTYAYDQDQNERLNHLLILSRYAKDT